MTTDIFPSRLLQFPESERVARIIGSALEAVSADQAVIRNVVIKDERVHIGEVSFPIKAESRIFVIGAGKACIKMAQGLYQVLGDRIAGGIIISKHQYPEVENFPKSIEVLIGAHPVPDDRSVNSTKKLMNFSSHFKSNDLVFCLLSGGGSSLLSLPYEGIRLGEFQTLIQNLLASGADITEMNTLRKHLDQIKGGGLAKITAPAQLITLVLSDVIGNPLNVIASGPTSPDPTTFADALHIILKYQLETKIPTSILATLDEGRDGKIPETLKADHPRFQKVFNKVVGSNEIAARSALNCAQEQGFHTLLLSTYLNGEAKEAGKFLSSLLREIDHSGNPLPRPACIIAGGETTVTLLGSGKGGRNQELALGAVMGLADLKDVALIALATDGEDGTTDAAGAVVTGNTFLEGKNIGLDPNVFLQDNDSFHYFEKLKKLVKTGPTGTNVNDLNFLFAF
jgi:glycerate 2-kinase